MRSPEKSTEVVEACMGEILKIAGQGRPSNITIEIMSKKYKVSENHIRRVGQWIIK